MREQTLREFFEGTVPAAALAHDLAGSVIATSAISTEVMVADMAEEFTVRPEHAVRLCDAILNGELPPDSLATIGFALMASDRFHWDGDREEVLAEAIADWAAPEINYPLTTANIELFRKWLLGIEPYPKKQAGTNSKSRGNLFSVRRKNSSDR
jgi:hypothetical protein